MNTHDKVALLAGELAVHQYLFTLRADENPADTYPGMAAVFLDASIDDIDFSRTSPLDIFDEGTRSFVEAALIWRDRGRQDDETFTKALDALEVMTSRMVSERSGLKIR